MGQHYNRKKPTLEAVLALVQSVGDGLTTIEIIEETGLLAGTVRSAIRDERQRNGSKNLRIAEWREVRGRGGKPQPVYVPGPGRDAPKPKFKAGQAQAEAQLRYRTKFRALVNAKTRMARGSKTTASPFDGLFK